jgi:hypothetical protein
LTYVSVRAHSDGRHRSRHDHHRLGRARGHPFVFFITCLLPAGRPAAEPARPLWSGREQYAGFEVEPGDRGLLGWRQIEGPVAEPAHGVGDVRRDGDRRDGSPAHRAGDRLKCPSLATPTAPPLHPLRQQPPAARRQVDLQLGEVPVLRFGGEPPTRTPPRPPCRDQASSAPIPSRCSRPSPRRTPLRRCRLRYR